MVTRILALIRKYKGFQFIVFALAEFTLYHILHGTPPFIPLLIIVWVALFLYNILNTYYREKCHRNSLLFDVWKYNESPFILFQEFANADEHELDVSEFPVRDWKNTQGLIFGYSRQGNLVYLRSNAEANIAVFGAPGSSKTVSFVKPNARNFGGSVLAVDIKGDIYEYNKYYRNIIRFAPDIPDAVSNSAHYNPFAGFKELARSELKLKVSNMAEVLIPNYNERDGYFSITARKLFTGILLFLLEECPDLTFPEFLHAVLQYQRPRGWRLEQFPSNVFQWIECVAYSPYPDAVEQVSAMLGNNERNIAGVADRLNTALVPFSNEILDALLTDNGSCICAQSLETGHDVYLQIGQDNLRTYAPLITLIMNSFMSVFTRRGDSAYATAKNRPILMILDEFPTLTFSYDSINEFLSTLRSKSITIMMICQSVSQIAYKYGDAGYHALMGNCIYQVCCKSNDPITVNHFMEIIGNKRTLKRGSSAIEDEEPVYHSADYGALSDTAIVYFNGKHAELKKIRSYE